ncbi:MAG: ClpX C4-type zinc finger protein [Vulcanimicrobiota bacterium]
MWTLKQRAMACSFCGHDEKTVAKLIAGPPGIFICGGCVGLCQQVLRGDATPDFSRLDQLSELELLASLKATQDCVAAVEGMLAERVAQLRLRGVAWQEIGQALGISRQAAWERFRV